VVAASPRSSRHARYSSMWLEKPAAAAPRRWPPTGRTGADRHGTSPGCDPGSGPRTPPAATCASSRTGASARTTTGVVGNESNTDIVNPLNTREGQLTTSTARSASWRSGTRRSGTYPVSFGGQALSAFGALLKPRPGCLQTRWDGGRRADTVDHEAFRARPRRSGRGGSHGPSRRGQSRICDSARPDRPLRRSAPSWTPALIRRYGVTTAFVAALERTSCRSGFDRTLLLGLGPLCHLGHTPSVSARTVPAPPDADDRAKDLAGVTSQRETLPAHMHSEATANESGRSEGQP
jgi:hypothetical protein